MLAGGTRIVVVMVGLPARGKTYISYKVSRYLVWLGVNCRVFNVGEYRRTIVGAQLDHSFFDPHNQVATDQRLNCAMVALNDVFRWFEAIHNGVAIYDATNSTRSRRKMILDECQKHNIEVMFCESWCDDNDLIDLNIREVKRTSPDYKGVQDVQRVMDDFHNRIDHYSEVYEPVGGDGTRPLAKGKYQLPPTNPTLEEYDERMVSYVRKINVGAKIIINRITSYLESRIIYFMMNIHIATRSVFFSRHGESMYNLDQRLGGDPHLSPNGRKYAEALPGLVSKLLGDQPLTIWTSTLKRTAETAAGLPYKKMQWKALDELDAGLCDGLTYEDVQDRYPDEYAMRDENKFEFRYRGGESYRDVVLRLEPVIMELERQQNIMIISHQAVLRCIYAYFLDIKLEELPYLKIPLHTVMKLTWTAYGCDVQTYKIDIDAVDTHRAKPKAAVKRAMSAAKSVSGLASETPSRSLSSKPSAVGLGQQTCGSAPVQSLETTAIMNLMTKKGEPSASAEEDAAEMPLLATPPPVSQEEQADSAAIRSAFQTVAAASTPVPSAIRGELSRLSVSGGHDHGSCDSSHAGHMWPSQISPVITRENSRVPSPDLVPHGHPGRFNPRKGSPVYLSPSDFATSFEMHRMQSGDSNAGEAGSSPELTNVVARPRGSEAGTPASGHHRQPLLAKLKIDELHLAGHGNVDIVESTPTITLRYSSDLPPDVKKQTMAMKNELVGIEDEEDSSSERSSTPPVAVRVANEQEE
ncbi:Fructose-2,6-bisphosphatase [Kickxella alabastrina]|uniref:Fructose-2,6-bisphosphatase n=1 Tax=Kickxella alabastrina TaxID=61397 RepID=A0ACC1IJ87_9FUNG|nr:Fructose-2,6-bisphosphatase [Kickxella alabastrina]